MTVFEHPDEGRFTIAGVLWTLGLTGVVGSWLQPAEVCSATLVTPPISSRYEAPGSRLLVESVCRE